MPTCAMLHQFPTGSQIKRRLINVVFYWKQEKKGSKPRRRKAQTVLYVSIPNEGHWTEYSPAI